MKSKLLVRLLVVCILSIGIITLLTGCGDNKPENSGAVTTKITAQPTYTKKAFKVEATVPGVEKETDGKKEVVPDYKVATSGLKNPNADTGIIGDKVEFDFDYTSYTYNSYANYKLKYGTKETSYDNYLEFLEDSEFDDLKASQKSFEKTTFAGCDAIKYEFSNSMIYVINCDKLDSKLRFECKVSPINKDDKIADLLENESIKNVMNSFVINEYSE